MLFKLRFVQDRLIKDTSSDDQHNRNVKIHSEQTKMNERPRVFHCWCVLGLFSSCSSLQSISYLDHMMYLL